MKLSANKILGHGGSKNEKRRMGSGVRKPRDKFANHSNSINPTPKCRASKSTFDSLNDDHGLILEIRSSRVTTVTPNQRRQLRKINRRRVTCMQGIRIKLSAEASKIFSDSQASLLLDPGLAFAIDNVDDDEDNHRDEELL